LRKGSGFADVKKEKPPLTGCEEEEKGKGSRAK